jgi:mono/diheme cytochrome c family protein/plastocyanin
MTDQPGREPEERLPVPRPTVEPVSPERFAAPPSDRRFGLTPERAAQIVRQSSSARFVGFLAVGVVVLFVIVYYFYELGFPGGLIQSRLAAETEAQQVTAVERGYNIYEANCARCHGANGEGGIGPKLNDQSKLFWHLREDYLRNILEVGGRYACGDPNSLMPVWSDRNGGPLNYMAIEDLIAFLRATNERQYTVRDPELFEPVIDPTTGKPKTFTGWRDPNWKPEPGATPYPACWKDEFTQPATPAPSPGASPEASPGASPSAPAGVVLEISAQNIAFDRAELRAPANTPFQIRFTNNDAGIPHNVAIHEGSPTGPEVWRGEIFNGVETRVYDVPALPAGTYGFICTVHPNMTGTLVVE